MANEETEVQTKFHSFLKQRNNKTNVAMQEAQRLVNLYRVLNDFGPDFVEEYNRELKNSSDEVQMALKALVAGEEVRQYLEFLKSEEKKENDSDNAQETRQQTGWLPSPDQEAGQTRQEESGAFISKNEWNNFIQDQNEKLTEMMNKLRIEQNETLTRLMDQLSMVKGNSAENKTMNAPKAPIPQYSEIIEEKK